MRPHVVKSVEDATTGKVRHTVAKEVGRIDVPARGAAAGEKRDGGGQSGGYRAHPVRGPIRLGRQDRTAQVVGIKQNEKYDVSKVSERFRDHSLFVASRRPTSPRSRWR
jgi:penicillin-binding protein 2